MTRFVARARRALLALSGAGTVALFEGCDPTLRATAEDGIITTANGLFASLLRALIELGQEQPQQTVQAILDPLLHALA